MNLAGDRIRTDKPIVDPEWEHMNESDEDDEDWEHEEVCENISAQVKSDALSPIRSLIWYWTLDRI